MLLLLIVSFIGVTVGCPASLRLAADDGSSTPRASMKSHLECATIVLADDSWSSRIIIGLVPLATYTLNFTGQMLQSITRSFTMIIMGLFITTSICNFFTSVCTINFPGIVPMHNDDQLAGISRPFINSVDDENLLTDLIAQALQRADRNKKRRRGKPLDYWTTL